MVKIYAFVAGLLSLAASLNASPAFHKVNSDISAPPPPLALRAASDLAPRAKKIAPKVMFIANTYEYSFLTGYNFSEHYTSTFFSSKFACTRNLQTCMLNVGQELRSAMNIMVLLSFPNIDLSKTYIIISGTGGVNPKYGTAGGVAISRFSVQWEWGSMLLGADLPANFSSQYFFAYNKRLPSIYPYLVGTEAYELNAGLRDRFYNLTCELKLEDVDAETQSLRAQYTQAAAQRKPFISKCDVVSAQVYWHGDVAAQNVEYYTALITNGSALPCNANEDDQGRLAALFQGARYGAIDFSRIAMVKAFSNFDRPPPGMSAYVSLFLVGETANQQGLANAWKSIKVMAKDVIKNWDTVYEKGITPPNYIGDPCGTLGGTPDFAMAGAGCGGMSD